MNTNKPMLGIIGGGQLGSMLCQAATKLNIGTTILTDDKESPAQNFCDKFIYTEYTSSETLEQFAKSCDFITFEFENIPFEILDKVSKITRVYPDPQINKIVQNRFEEKNFLKTLEIATTSYALIKSKQDIEKNINLLPGILKTCTLGYDGKGQFVIKTIEDVKNEWCFSDDYILEKFINLKQEISIIITRYQDGSLSIFEPFENIHKDQILNTTTIPANITKEIFKEAQEIAKKISEKLQYIGTMCVEFFIDQENKLYVNEIAPRVHNSGHLTINSHNISQFENHIRAVCHLENIPLKKISNAKMTNIIGNEITKYRSRTFAANEFFFDYLKKDIKDKRKMGHFTILK